MHEPILKRYGEVVEQINDGDLLLFQGGHRLASLMIRVGGRSPYSHAAMAAWEGHELRLLEVTQYYGGRERSLLDVIKEEPGHWDVFEANADDRWTSNTLGPWIYNSERAVGCMKSFVGSPYGWKDLLLTALPHLALVRLFFHPDFENDHSQSKFTPFCSEAVARAHCAGGVDPVPNLADRYTEPGDLARSLFYRYRFTLVP
jgi:hypothetical protein